ncbi:U1 small nuclear ribonucleoprotein c [Thalictrum thalictroides]|uniref:U1 small nuclear ribonucleoprotein C n=1 Tax=Thalictrum thalictroides TaxID=46969 RepID=A0A7J6VXH2_THATH|nr:U1 small nuclear ribonucleoprotein c [Thalictrum thalictroides]
MPRYYCDYCDTYLTHDSPSVRKQHNSGYKHKANVRSYYEQFEKQQTQSLIDQKIKEHLGQTAAFQQVGAAYNQHLAAYPPRPRPPILPIPLMPNMGNSQMPPGLRPPVFPRPVGVPGYGTAPMPSMMSAPMQSAPMQVNGLPRPPTLGAPTATPGVPAVSSSNVYKCHPPMLHHKRVTLMLKPLITVISLLRLQVDHHQFDFEYMIVTHQGLSTNEPDARIAKEIDEVKPF